MNFGIGTDIEDINRFMDLTLENDSAFLNKIFTKSEIKYCFSSNKSHISLASRFVGKEAIYKALCSVGINGIAFNEIAIINDSNGVPHVSILRALPFKIEIKVSISHCEDKAIAFVIAQKLF